MGPTTIGWPITNRIYIYMYIYIIPLGYSCIKSGGLSSKNRFILYRGIPLWLGSTGEGCDSIQVLGCQTRAWRSTFCTRASLVHMVLRVLILYWCPFYARLEARLGVQFLYYARMQTEVGWFYLNLLKFLMFKLGALDSVANPAYPM